MTIIFMVDSFPCISETFILNQITGMIDGGHEVFIFSAGRSYEKNYHEDVHKYELLKRIYYHNEMPSSKLKRVLWIIFMILAYGHRNPKAIFNSLNFFKYGKEAFSLNYLYKVMLFLGVNKADIILCHYGHNGNLAALMKELGIAGKVVTMFHGYDIRRGLETQGLYKLLFKRADAILSISDYNYKHLLEFGAPVERVRYHPVGIDTKRYASIKPKTIDAGMPVKILTIGRLVEEKGFSYAIEAIHQLVFKKGLTNIEYYILGDGPLRKELEAYGQKLQLKNKIYFLGYQVQEGVDQLLARSHLFILPSVAEALPVVLMEAQAAGLPVVATNVGSVSQVMLDTLSGFIVPARDVTAMCDKLEYLICNPDRWGMMGQAGRKHIQENYDIKELNQRLDNLCNEMIKS
ncbi:MAG: glycosyltransferase [Candidatus Omnitrophica bacterium]|nr:glycosyltransferase [Candidatus Omnitrophota bacterium]